MSSFGPFEPRPHLAVAVSGGADSMALALLARDWAKARRGTVTALTVDHGLRPESGAEARLVARRLGSLGIRHHILTWHPAPEDRAAASVQVRARDARYRLLDDWCGRAGVLHLLLAHQLNDQAETELLRLGRDSGLAGLAAMAGLREKSALRLLRPLLAMPRASLEEYLRGAGIDWVSDPSNENTAFARVRLRALAPELAAEGLGVGALAELAGRFGQLRAALDDRVASHLARAASPHPAGFVRLNLRELCAAAPWLGAHALARVLAAVGGNIYPPREARLMRLYDEIAAGRLGNGRTLAGCRVLPDPGGLLVCREAAAVAPPVAARPGIVQWDGRVVWRLPAGAVPRGAFVGALGREGLAEIRARRPDLMECSRAKSIPAPAKPSLPALFSSSGLLAAPFLAYRRPQKEAARLLPGNCRVLSAVSLAGAAFFAAPGDL
jgi:tRNA(Ile)-lysidine synthase